MLPGSHEGRDSTVYDLPAYRYPLRGMKLWPMIDLANYPLLIFGLSFVVLWLSVLQINARTAQLQSELWSAVRAPAASQPTPVIALAISGMNDVLNSQGYTQAAWWNRIPFAAWGMMAAIAICANLLVGYGARKAEAQGVLAFVLRLVVSIAFLLIADIDSPRGGIVRVRPQNLVSFAQSLHST